MGFIAIIGAGALGGAVAQTLAVRDRVREIRLIDPAVGVARGKALDIQQSGPIDSFRAMLSAAETIDAAVGAEVVVIADAAAGGEHGGEAALGIVRHLSRAGHGGPILFAGAAQSDVLGKAVTELHLERRRVLGSAPLALESALRALAGLLLDGSAVEVTLHVVGVPPRHAVVAWEEATAHGQPLTSLLPAHAIAGLAARVPGLWPPGPYALASAAARAIEAIAAGSRRRYSCFVVTEDGPIRAAVVAMPVELASSGVARVHEPALTRQERTAMENAMARAHTP